MRRLTLTLLILFLSSSDVLTKTTKAKPTTTPKTTSTSTNTSKTTPSSQKLFCASCSYEYSFAELRNKSSWQSPWSLCENQTSATSKFGATACHVLLRIDYARQYVTVYYNASHLSLKKLPDDDRRTVFETTMSSNGSRAQLKVLYECSFEDNCHLPIDRFLQLRTALKFVNYNHTNLIQKLNKFYNKPKTEVDTYFNADTLTSTLNAFCGDSNRFDKPSLRTVKPKCLKKTDKLKWHGAYDDELTATVYTCDGPKNTYCSTEKKLKAFLDGITLIDYVQNFFQYYES